MGEATAAILAQVTSDLSEWMDCLWSVAISKVDGNPMPICVAGHHPNLSAFLTYLRSGLAETCTARLNCQPWMPHLLYPVEIPDAGQILLAFGPKKNHEPYALADRDLVSTLLSQVGAVLSNGRLALRVGASIEATRRTQEELKAAREVQCRLLPAHRPTVQGIDYYGHCEQAGPVGGDFFDFLPIANSKLAISIGDVSGKGIPAAIIMSGLQATLRSTAETRGTNVSRLVNEVNRLVWEMSPDNVFATLFYAVLDAPRNRLLYVNVGHEPPLLFRSRTGRTQRLESTGPVLGLRRNLTYRETSLNLDTGDVLVAFTDGVTEAFDEEGRELRETDLLRTIHEHNQATPVDLAHYILDFVDSFTGGASRDDTTVLVARFNGAPEISLARTQHAMFQEGASRRAMPTALTA